MRKFMRVAVRLLLWLTLLGAVIAVGLAAGAAWAVNDVAKTMPTFKEMKDDPTGTTIRMFSSDGELIHREGPQYGEWIRYDEIPSSMRAAMVAIEDRRYRTHHGIDPQGIARAAKHAWDNRGKGRRLQGASTITQQAARTLFLDRGYSYKRKINEMVIALAMERRLSKDQILELYLNQVYFGGGAYGIDAASRRFFNHPATELTVSEAALLAGLVKAPSDYAPTADAEAAVGRMGVVLSKMVEYGQIQEIPGKDRIPEIYEEPEQQRTAMRNFVDWTMKQINALAPDSRGNIDIMTTLDTAMQNEALDALRANVPGGAQGAIVSMEDNGAIRAMVGGLDWNESMYNRATEALRQPGSSFKPFVYLTALEQGYGPSSAVVDRPVTIGDWSPRNSNGRYMGRMPMSRALAQSINTVSVRLARSTGYDAVAEMANRLGISTGLNATPSLALGASEVRLLDMVRAYSVLSANGRSNVPYGVDRIEQNGRIIYQHKEDDRQQVISEGNASAMTSMLMGAVTNGTGGAAQIGRPMAGKTGTTNSNKDGWFVGYSSGLVTGVWIGRDDARPISSLQGGRAPARTFSRYMKAALAERPVTPLNGTAPKKIEPNDELDKAARDAAEVAKKALEASKTADESKGERQTIPVEKAATTVSQPPPAAPNATSEGRSRAIRPDE